MKHILVLIITLLAFTDSIAQNPEVDIDTSGFTYKDSLMSIYVEYDTVSITARLDSTLVRDSLIYEVPIPGDTTGATRDSVAFDIYYDYFEVSDTSHISIGDQISSFIRTEVVRRNQRIRDGNKQRRKQANKSDKISERMERKALKLADKIDAKGIESVRRVNIYADEVAVVDDVAAYKRVLQKRGWTTANDITATYKRAGDIRDVAKDLGIEDTSGNKTAVAQRIIDKLNE